MPEHASPDGGTESRARIKVPGQECDRNGPRSRQIGSPTVAMRHVVPSIRPVVRVTFDQPLPSYRTPGMNAPCPRVLQVALKVSDSTERPSPVTLEALEVWGDNLVTRVAEAARTEAAPKDDAAAAHLRGIEEAAAKAAAAAERIAGGQDSTADRVATEIEGAVTRIETGLATTRNANRQQSRQADPILEEILTRTAGLRFGWRAVLLFLIVLVLGMLLESRIHTLYRWLWAG